MISIGFDAVWHQRSSWSKCQSTACWISLICRTHHVACQAYGLHRQCVLFHVCIKFWAKVDRTLHLIFSLTLPNPYWSHDILLFPMLIRHLLMTHLNRNEQFRVPLNRPSIYFSTRIYAFFSSFSSSSCFHPLSISLARAEHVAHELCCLTNTLFDIFTSNKLRTDRIFSGYWPWALVTECNIKKSMCQLSGCCTELLTWHIWKWATVTQWV